MMSLPGYGAGYTSLLLCMLSFGDSTTGFKWKKPVGVVAPQIIECKNTKPDASSMFFSVSVTILLFSVDALLAYTCESVGYVHFLFLFLLFLFVCTVLPPGT